MGQQSILLLWRISKTCLICLIYLYFIVYQTNFKNPSFNFNTIFILILCTKTITKISEILNTRIIIIKIDLILPSNFKNLTRKNLELLKENKLFHSVALQIKIAKKSNFLKLTSVSLYKLFKMR